uniref:Serpentine receptor class gamma n=1 Tax=Panagrellus redivivus TaxID=6233 RepID=A0A7E4VCD1_PANRE
MMMDLAAYCQGRILGAPVFLSFVESLPTDGAFPMVFAFLGYGSIYCGQCLNALLSFNRFSVIYLKANYVDFWKKYLKYFLIAAFTIPILMTIQFTVTQPAILFYLDSEPQMGYYLKERVSKPIYNKSARSAVLFGFTGVCAFCMDIYVLKHLMKHRQKTKARVGITVAVSMSDLSPTNARFLAFNLLIFGCECMVAFIQVGFTVLEKMIKCVNNTFPDADDIRQIRQKQLLYPSSLIYGPAVRH